MIARTYATININPYGTSKLMSEMMLRDLAAATPLRFVALRYFNVAGCDPQGRIGQSTPHATLLTKVACEVAVGKLSHQHHLLGRKRVSHVRRRICLMKEKWQ